MAMTTMDISNACPTEDAVQALLEYFVDPIIPAKASLRDTPALSEQILVAKQVHAVVLLYNYYHVKSFPQLTNMGFESFCKLVVGLRPSMTAYLKLMLTSSDVDLDENGKQPSLLEKTIIDACNICSSLDVLRGVPNLEGWPISKIEVFLVDSKKDNCYLQLSSNTQGVWSLIEKGIDAPHKRSNGKNGKTSHLKHILKKIKVDKEILREELSASEVGFQQLAFSAVEEATGITQSDLTIMESHRVYSLSKEKSVVRFYIMQCTLPSDHKLIQISIKDVIYSLQGPLFHKNCFGWTLSPVVEYFHALPYAGILSDWFSGLQGQRLESKSTNDSVCEMIDLAYNQEVNVSDPFSHGCSVNNEPVNTNDNSDSSMSGFNDDSNGSYKISIDDSFVVNPQKEELHKDASEEVPDTNPPNSIDLHVDGDLDAKASGNKVKVVADSSLVPYNAEYEVENKKAIGQSEEVENDIVVCNGTVSDQNGVPNGYHSLSHCQSNLRNLDRLQTTIASKENKLSQTALRVLHTKRDKLTIQLRDIKDEIAQCDKKIRTILSDGENNLAIKIDSIIEGCNDVYLGNVVQQAPSQHSSDKCACHQIKIISDSVFNMQNPCQELDSICCEKKWILPTYCVYPSNGGFQATVILKGIGFERTSFGDERLTPREARESAATRMLTMLHSKD